MNYSNHIWAIDSNYIQELQELLKIDASALSALSKDSASPMKKEKVVILPLYNTIFQKENYYTKYGYGTSTETFGSWLDSAVQDDTISKIIIDCNSPGGSVYGVKELSDKIYSYRNRKPIVAVVNSLCASAAYYICSACSSIVCTPSGEAGSIGVYMIHLDYSKYLEKEGIKATIVKAGKFKAEGNPYQELTPEAVDNLQANVDEYYEQFISTVARNRGLSKSVVKDTFGQGRCLVAKESLKVGMTDKIQTLEDTVIKRNNSLSRMKAEIDLLKVK